MRALPRDWARKRAAGRAAGVGGQAPAAAGIGCKVAAPLSEGDEGRERLTPPGRKTTMGKGSQERQGFSPAASGEGERVMATDVRLKEALPEITEAVVATYAECSRTSHLGHRALPSREAVVEILSDFLDI